jgi:hypothetical protein
MIDMRTGYSVRHSGLAARGIVLCLLAVLFAVEAKMARYIPAGNASSQISSAKLMPAEAPKLIAHSIGAQAPAVPAFIEDLAPVVVALLYLATVSLIARAGRPSLQFSALPSFSISLFFRPPPSL